MIIGVAGTLASGKDTVSEILMSEGLQHVSLSEILREILRAKGIETTTENLTREGNAIRQEKGEGYLAKEAIKRIKGDAIISSIRQPGEVDYLHQRKDFYMIAVDADIKLRWSRLKKRQRPGDPTSFEDMLSIEKRQMKSGGSKDMQNDVVMEKADYHIDNNGTLEQLKAQVDNIINKIRKLKAKNGKK